MSACFVLLGLPSPPKPQPPGAPAPRVLFGIPSHPIPTPWEGDDRGVGPALRRGGLTTDHPLPWAPIGPPPTRDAGCGLAGESDGWALAPPGPGRGEGCGLRRGSPLPTPPMPGRLDVAEGLSPLCVGSLQRTRAKGVTRSPAILKFFYFCSSMMNTYEAPWSCGRLFGKPK